MIRDWHIRQFGPIGISSATLEAPGSMCVIVAPGLTTPPEVPAETPAEVPVYIVAGSSDQFGAYLRARELPRAERLGCRYVTSSASLLGLTKGRFILTGTYWRHWDWTEIHRSIEILRRFWGCDVVIDHD